MANMLKCKQPAGKNTSIGSANTRTPEYLAASVNEFIGEHLELISSMKWEESKKMFSDLKEFGKFIAVEMISCEPSEFGGKIVTFQIRHPDIKTPPMRKGEPIAALQLPQKVLGQPTNGIVTKIGHNHYEVCFDNKNLRPSKDWTLIKNYNALQYDIMEKAIVNVAKNKSPLRDILLGKQKPSKNELGETWIGIIGIPFVNKSLDSSQEAAVEFAMNQNELALIHGPAGTGKSTTLKEIILQSSKLGKKILVTAATNIAVDNLGERLLKDINIVRIGHPARVSKALVPYCLNVLVQKEFQETSELDAQIQHLTNKIRMQWSIDEYKQLQELKNERNISQKKLNEAMKTHLQNASAVFSTLTGCGPSSPLKLLPKTHFDIVIIDEAGQSLECASWIAIHRASKLILAGDHMQLPPCVISSEKVSENKLKISLMERLGKDEGIPVSMLKTQYRMNEAIMNWSSTTFYNGNLVADKSVKDQRLCDLPNVSTNECTTTVLQLFDTKGKGYTETHNNAKNGASWANIGEAVLIINYVKKLLESGVKAEQIAIIAPYNYQIEILNSNLLEKGLDIKSVDGFQGREKEVVIISMVRSNPFGCVGFLKEGRRLNVAVTRAKKQLVVVCDSGTICRNKFLEDFILYMKKNGKTDAAPKLEEKEANLVIPKNQ